MKTFDKTDYLNLKSSNQSQNDNHDNNLNSKLSVYNDESDLKPKNRESSFYLYDFESKSIQWSQRMYQSCDNSILTIKPLLILSSLPAAAPEVSPAIMSWGSYLTRGAVDWPQEPEKFCFKFLLERLPCYTDDEYNLNQHIKNYKGNVQDGDIFI